MKKNTPRTPGTEADAESRDMWRELATIEGCSAAPTKVARHTRQLLALNGIDRDPDPRDFVHPEATPKSDTMLSDLARSRDDGYRRGFGAYGLQSASDFALHIDTLIYNNWVELQCRKHSRRSPGKLTEDQFCDRYWNSDPPDDDD